MPRLFPLSTSIMNSYSALRPSARASRPSFTALVAAGILARSRAASEPAAFKGSMDIDIHPWNLVSAYAINA
jgi:hypothetical protein